ncbi:MAG: HAMP domain-containing protein [candidate division NC10 bacterium]|nr:HAMP domain-containing protein [candidate division NC10 bacterium]MBI2561032.1 HAMP domain-containing protein [candidate division NC10 bacterium]
MRIATRLTLLLLAAVAVVMAGFGYIRTHQERQRLIAEAQQEVLVLANAIKLTVEHALRDRQPQDIRELLTEMVRNPNPVDRIRIFDRRLEDISSAMSDVAATTLIPQAELEQVLKSGRTIVRYLDIPARPAAYAILPLKTRRGATIGVLEVVHVATRVQRQIQDATHDQILRLSLLSLTIALVIWLTVRVSIRRPVAQLVRTALAFGHGDLSRRLRLRRRDEIGQLASAFNRMAESLQAAQAQIVTEAQARLELERQAQQAQKLAAVGRLASEVAHEIGTPLNIVSGRAEVIQKGLPADHPLSRHVATILRQIERISGIIRQLLEYARPRRPTPRAGHVGPILIRTVELLEPLARQRRVSLQSQASDGLPPLLADPDQLQQVLLNLVTNALDATPPGGQVRLAACPADAEAPDGRPRIQRGHAVEPFLTLVVSDTGRGMPRDQLEQIFEPFFSTKERGGGTGLGMPIVEDIVRAHRGAIEVQSAAGAGTTVLLRWPATHAGDGGQGSGARTNSPMQN